MSKGKETKPHIGIFGRRNNGKSSLINALTGQDIAIVSDIPGTTTDPVKKSMEINGLGPAILIDTAGLDDSGELGKKRVDKTLHTLKSIDAAILVIAQNTWGEPETSIITEFHKFDIPFSYYIIKVI
ncbi:MAG: GTP-binding protein [Bacteroidetes bacterium]|nr:GTP-binding protein [Bacteroidota bacterium]